MLLNHVDRSIDRRMHCRNEYEVEDANINENVLVWLLMV